jgi:hypothetical protein
MDFRKTSSENVTWKETTEDRVQWRALLFLTFQFYAKDSFVGSFVVVFNWCFLMLYGK